MKKLLALSRKIDSFNECLGRLTSWLVLLMILAGVWNVGGRKLGQLLGQNLTSNVFVEIQWYLFDLIFLLGGAYALKHDEHVRVDIFYKNWNPKRKALANLIGSIFFLIPFCMIAIVFSWKNVLHSWQVWEISPDPGGLARYPIKSMIIVNFILLIFQGISEAIKNWAILTNNLLPQEERHDVGI